MAVAAKVILSAHHSSSSKIQFKTCATHNTYNNDLQYGMEMCVDSVEVRSADGNVKTALANMKRSEMRVIFLPLPFALLIHTYAHGISFFKL